jgi:hypothetical protein
MMNAKLSARGVRLETEIVNAVGMTSTSKERKNRQTLNKSASSYDTRNYNIPELIIGSRQSPHGESANVCLDLGRTGPQF